MEAWYQAMHYCNGRAKWLAEELPDRKWLVKGFRNKNGWVYTPVMRKRSER